MPRLFLYNELGKDEPIKITEEEILNQYYPYWCQMMLKVHKLPMITEKNCIRDFIDVNWAWEVQ